MVLYIDTAICDACGTCISVCPENALIMTDALCVDRTKCSGCARCVSVCPCGALGLVEGPERHGE